MSDLEIESMSTGERLATMERLWDALCREEDALPSPEWHGAVLEERASEANNPETRWLTLEELQNRLG